MIALLSLFIATMEFKDIAGSQDGSTLAIMSDLGNVDIWRLAKRPVLLRTIRIQGSPGDPQLPHLAVSPHGERLAVALSERPIRIYQLHPFHLVSELPMTSGTTPITPYAYTWQPRTNRLVALTSNDESFMETGSPAHWKKLPITCQLVWMHNGKMAAGTTSTGAALIEVETGKVFQKFEEQLETDRPLALSPDGKYLITAGEDPTWHGPEIATGAPAPTGVAYIHNGTFKVWRVKDGKRIRLLPGYPTSWDNPRIAFLGPHQLALVNTGDVYDVETGKRVRGFKPPKTYAYDRFLLPQDPTHPLQFHFIKLPASG